MKVQYRNRLSAPGFVQLARWVIEGSRPFTWHQFVELRDYHTIYIFEQGHSALVYSAVGNEYGFKCNNHMQVTDVHQLHVAQTDLAVDFSFSQCGWPRRYHISAFNGQAVWAVIYFWSVVCLGQEIMTNGFFKELECMHLWISYYFQSWRLPFSVKFPHALSAPGKCEGHLTLSWQLTWNKHQP